MEMKKETKRAIENRRIEFRIEGPDVQEAFLGWGFQSMGS